MNDKDKGQFATSVLFWMGVAYMTVVVYIMTPYTHQLDDIKVTMIHALGPGVIVTYLGFLALGMVPLPRRTVLIPLGGYYLTIALSAALSERHCQWQAWDMAKMHWVLLGPFLAFFVSGADPRRLRHALVFFTLLTLGSAIFGLAHYWGGAKWVLKYYDWAYGPRLPQVAPFGYLLARTFDGAQEKGLMLSVILNRDFYAAFLLLMIPIAMASGYASRKTSWRAVSGITFVLGAICLSRTKSQTSFIAFGIIMGLIVVLYFFLSGVTRELRRRFLVVVAGGLATAIIPLALVVKPGWLAAHVKSLGVPIAARAIIWSGALGIWRDNPLLGGGPGTFGIFFPNHRRPDYFLYEISHRTIFAHNFFLDLLSETGAVGFAFFMTFLGFLAWKCLKRIWRDPDPRGRMIAICLFSGITAFLMNNFYSPNARWPIGAVNLWAALGLVAGMCNVPLGEKAARNAAIVALPPIALRRAAWTLCAASVVAWLGWLPRSAQPKWMRENFINSTAVHGVTFFRASVSNNDGVNLVGTKPDEGYLNTLTGRVARLRKDLSNPDLSQAEKAQLEERLGVAEEQFEKVRLEAIRCFERAVEICPTMTTSYYKLATLYYFGPRMKAEREDYEKALETYRKLEEYAPDYAQIHLNLAQTYAALDMHEEALREYGIAARATIDVDTNSAYVRYLLRRAAENPERQEERRAEALRTAVRVFDAWEEIFTGGREIRKRAAEKQKIREEATRMVVQTAQSAGDAGQEIRALRSWLTLRPDEESLAQRLLVRAYRRADRRREMEEFLAERVREFPMRTKARAELAEAYLEEGRIREAKEQALILQRLGPGETADASYLLYKVYEAAGNLEEAAKRARECLARRPDEARKKECETFLQKSAFSPSL